MQKIIKLFGLFVILCIPEGVYQQSDFKIIIHLYESDEVRKEPEEVKTPDTVPTVGGGWNGKFDISF